MSEILVIILGVVIITAIVLFWLKLNRSTSSAGKEEIDGLLKERDALATDKKVLEAKVQSLSDSLEKSEKIIDGKDETILELNRQLSTITADFKNIRNKLEEQKAELDAIQEKFTSGFKNLANEILEEKSKKFTEQNKTNLDQLLKPLGEKIRDFEKKVEETYDKESKQRFSLEKEIKNLAELNQKISQDAQNLTVALKSDSKKQGNWGELVLEKVLEGSGLVKGQEYIREFSTKTVEGDVYRPDVIINLPEKKHIIIDAKVSLVAYNDFINSDNQDDREKFLKLHLASIKNHIKFLGEKNYQKLDAFDTPDYVLLFIPIESSFSVALQADYELFSYAWERNVVIVSPTTLLATLRTVASIWKHEKQEMNVKEIARQSGELYDKFVGFLEDLIDIGNKLNATQKSYDASMNKLSTGKGNLIRRTEKLKELGLKPTKEIPKSLAENAEEGD
jgi:DNA recombination protein RmuC